MLRPATLLLVGLALVALLAPARADDGERGTLPWQGAQRSYLVFRPLAASGPLPLVIALHGAGEDAAFFAGETKFAAAAERQPMLVVFPDGTEGAPGRRSWNAHFCCGTAVAQRIDDMGFIGALIERIAADAEVDRKRIYATGMSNGGMFAYQLAAAHPDWFAAIAPVSASIAGTARSGEAFIINAPDRPVSVLVMHGRKDSYVMFDGGASPALSFPNHWKSSVADALSFWAAADGCSMVAERSEPVPGVLRHVDYGDCRVGSTVALWEIEGGDHEWPADIFPGLDGPHSAAAEILAFFAAHHRE